VFTANHLANALQDGRRPALPAGRGRGNSLVWGLTVSGSRRQSTATNPSGSANGTGRDALESEYIQLMEWCWAEDPNERPSFEVILQAEILEEAAAEDVGQGLS
jgi:hypothetical protein